jgi:membrane-anchored protein YejM (alkaline phosphatase superfamily)
VLKEHLEQEFATSSAYASNEIHYLEYSLEVVKQLIKEHKLPDFLYMYLPDLDQKVHKKGLSDFEGVVQVDQQLESLLQAFGSKEEALKNAVVIIIGDSGATQILPANHQVED